jgi:hypothetical protein
VSAAVIALGAAGANEPAFAAAGEPVSAFVAGLEQELAGSKPAPKSHSELEARLRDDLWKNTMRQVPTLRAFGRVQDVDQVTPFWRKS